MDNRLGLAAHIRSTDVPNQMAQGGTGKGLVSMEVRCCSVDCQLEPRICLLLGSEK